MMLYHRIGGDIVSLSVGCVPLHYVAKEFKYLPGCLSCSKRVTHACWTNKFASKRKSEI
jgi:hypothetical protein